MVHDGAEPARTVKGPINRAQPARAVKASQFRCNRSAESAQAEKGSNNTQYIHLLEICCWHVQSILGVVGATCKLGTRAGAYTSHVTSINQSIFRTDFAVNWSGFPIVLGSCLAVHETAVRTPAPGPERPGPLNTRQAAALE